MLTAIIPKLPMRDLRRTRAYYTSQLDFIAVDEFGNYLIVKKGDLEIHFFEFKELDPKENYGQIYIRTDDIEVLYLSLMERDVEIHPNGALQNRAWGQKEFSLLDPDNNLITFGQSV